MTLQNLARSIIVIVLFVLALLIVWPRPVRLEQTLIRYEPRSTLVSRPERVAVEFRARTQHPSDVGPDEGFTIQLHLEIVEVLAEGKRVRLDDQSVETLVTQPSLDFSLELAGAEIRPPDPIRVSWKAPGVWSVRPKAAGKLAGWIRPHRSRDDNKPLRVDLFTTVETIWPKSNDIPIAITVGQRWWEYVAGGLLALCGLIIASTPVWYPLLKEMARDIAAWRRKPKSKIILEHE